MSLPDPVAEHDRSAGHRAAVLAAEHVGCFYCCEIYAPSEIEVWVDPDDPELGTTAVCPRCSIDAVIPVRPGVDVAFLEAMHRHWFS